MFNSPYETSVGQSYNLENLKRALIPAIKQGSLEQEIILGVPEVLGITENNLDTENISPFSHPVKVDDKIVIDCRTFANKMRTDGRGLFLDENGPQGLLRKIALIELEWSEGNVDVVRRFTDLPLKVYSHWVGERIAKAVGSDPMETFNVVIAAGWFYDCQSRESDMLHRSTLDEDAISFARRFGKHISSSVSHITDIVMSVGYIKNIGEFCDALKKIGGNRLARVNTAQVVALLNNSWYGISSARELAGVAIEYPPYFISMLHTAITEQGYRKTVFVDIVKRGGRIQDLVRKMDLTMKSLIDELTK